MYEVKSSICDLIWFFFSQKRLTSAAKKAIAKLPTRTVSKKVKEWLYLYKKEDFVSTRINVEGF